MAREVVMVREVAREETAREVVKEDVGRNSRVRRV